MEVHAFATCDRSLVEPEKNTAVVSSGIRAVCQIGLAIIGLYRAAKFLTTHASGRNSSFSTDIARLLSEPTSYIRLSIFVARICSSFASLLSSGPFPARFSSSAM